MTTNLQGPAPTRPPALKRGWIYQRERFPILGHGPLILAFSFCAVSFSWMLRGRHGLPHVSSIVVAFATCFTFFLQLRIADEFKDFKEDSRYRPYRPVPRGLVSLRELAVVFTIGAAGQLVLAFWLQPLLALVLLCVWVYLAAMSVEFFVGRLLRPRPLLYMITHMAIMPQIDFYATSTDWLAAGQAPPRGLFWFLAASLFNGMVIEIGRKIRSPADEEEGVQTYSVVWGRSMAVAAWWLVLTLTLACAALAARRIGALPGFAAATGVVFAAAIFVGIWFLKQPVAGRGKRIEQLSGLWTLVLYLSLGALPLIGRH